jgi:hypothetical protein
VPHVFGSQRGRGLPTCLACRRICGCPMLALAEGCAFVSVYAFESGRRQILAVWPSGVGSTAQPVVSLPSAVAESGASELCVALSTLSEAVWATYARPASAAVDDDERSRREGERDSRDRVAEALSDPNLPDEFGMLIVSYSPVEESAHQLGRLLHGLGDAALAEAVVADVSAEIDAVVRAELGDLSGRAAQATALDRLDVSPVQVVAADDLLRADPLGAGLLTALVDPAAACVAAVRWLAAAAMVAADAADIEAADVFAEADNIEPVSVPVPSEVVALIVDDDVDAREVVLDLLRTAVAAGDGIILDPRQVLADVDELDEVIRGLPLGEQQEARDVGSIRATELDPRRPARDLLEHLLDGIASCRLLFAEVDEDFDEADQESDLDSADDLDPATESERRDRIAEKFADLVRVQVASNP